MNIDARVIKKCCNFFGHIIKLIAVCVFQQVVCTNKVMLEVAL